MRAPMTPAAGPDRNSRTGRCRAIAEHRDAAARLHDLQRRRDAGRGEPGFQVGEIAVDHRLHVGVEGGDDGALVLAEGRIDLAGERDEHVGVARGDDLAGAALVRALRNENRKHDRDRLRAGGDQLVGRGGDSCLVERTQHLAGRR